MDIISAKGVLVVYRKRHAEKTVSTLAKMFGAVLVAGPRQVGKTITLLGYSLREIYNVNFDTPFIPTEEYLSARKQHLTPIPYDEVWKLIHRGSMPELYENPDFDWQIFYAAYVRTYIERDVRDLSEIGDTVKFTKFMTATAAMTGNLLNLASLARDVGISAPTAER